MLALLILIAAAPPEADSPRSAHGTLPRLEEARYRVDAAARGSVLLLLPKGPRTILKLRAVPDQGTLERWKSARIKLYWETDEPDEPGLDLPLDLLFETEAKSKEWGILAPMPYRTVALLSIDADEALSGIVIVESIAKVAEDASYLRGSPISELSRDEQGEGRIVSARFSASSSSLGELFLDEESRGTIEAALKPPRESLDLKFRRSFRVESKNEASSRSSLLWHSDRPSSGRVR